MSWTLIPVIVYVWLVHLIHKCKTYWSWFRLSSRPTRTCKTRRAFSRLFLIRNERVLAVVRLPEYVRCRIWFDACDMTTTRDNAVHYNDGYNFYKPLPRIIGRYENSRLVLFSDIQTPARRSRRFFHGNSTSHHHTGASLSIITGISSPMFCQSLWVRLSTWFYLVPSFCHMPPQSTEIISQCAYRICYRLLLGASLTPAVPSRFKYSGQQALRERLQCYLCDA